MSTHCQTNAKSHMRDVIMRMSHRAGLVVVGLDNESYLAVMGD